MNSPGSERAGAFSYLISAGLRPSSTTFLVGSSNTCGAALHQRDSYTKGEYDLAD
jgi:hypothetical protein